MRPEDVRDLYDDAYAASYERKFLESDQTSADAAFEIEVLRSLLSPGARWLDVACGTGYFLRRFPDIDRAGIDLSPSMLARARAANPGVEIREHDFRMPIPEWADAFDVVSCMWYAYGYAQSMHELAMLIANLAAWTAPRGCCFVPLADPNLLVRQNLPYHLETGWPGEVYITGVLWSYVENEPYGSKVHRHMIAPAVEVMTDAFRAHFEEIELQTYPSTRPGLLAKRKRTGQSTPAT